MEPLTKNQKEMPETETSQNDKAKTLKKVKNRTECPRTTGQLQKV